MSNAWVHDGYWVAQCTEIKRAEEQAAEVSRLRSEVAKMAAEIASLRAELSGDERCKCNVVCNGAEPELDDQHGR